MARPLFWWSHAQFHPTACPSGDTLPAVGMAQVAHHPIRTNCLIRPHCQANQLPLSTSCGWCRRTQPHRADYPLPPRNWFRWPSDWLRLWPRPKAVVVVARGKVNRYVLIIQTNSSPFATMRHFPPTYTIPSGRNNVSTTDGRPIFSPCRKEHSLPCCINPCLCK